MTNTERTGIWISQEGEVLSADPTNPYRYVGVGNNPPNSTDPSGLAAVDAMGAALSVVSAEFLGPGAGIYPTDFIERMRNDEYRRGFNSTIGHAYVGTGVLMGGALAGGAAASRGIPAIFRWLLGRQAASIGAGAGGAMTSPQTRQAIERLGPAIERLAGRDRQIIERAAELIRTQPLPEAFQRLPTFAQHIIQLGSATNNIIPHGQVNHIGTYLGSDVWGSLISRVGIVSVEGVTIVVRRLADGSWEVLGRLL